MDVKAPGLTGRSRSKLKSLSMGEVIGTPGVVVKCVDIRKNTRGESGLLAQN